jgi:hypothetical protein
MSKIKIGFMFCPKCGKPVDDKAQVCPSCNTGLIYDQFIGRGISENTLTELKERVLKNDETVLAMIKGLIETPWSLGDLNVSKTKHARVAEGRHGVLACTNQRLIFYMPKLLGRWEVESASLDQVSAVHFNKGLTAGRIHVIVYNSEKVIKWISNDEGEKMVKLIEKEQEKNRGDYKTTNLKVEPKEDPLQSLKMRFVKGEITQEQYQEMKKILES